MNLIIIFINVDINEKKNEISLKKSSLIKMKNLLTDQLFSEFSVTISVEIFSTSDSLTVRISLTAKSVLMILHHFLCRAVRAAFKNINLSNLAILNLIFQTVKIALSANQALTISDSDFQAVKVASSTHRLCD